MQTQVSVDITLIKMMFASAKQGNMDTVILGLNQILDQFDRQQPTDDAVPIVAALFRKNGKYLLARRKPHKHLGGLWEFPGGKVNEGESEREAMRRQIKEEMGINAVVGDLIAQSTYQYCDMPLLRIRLYDCKSEDKTFSLSDHDAAKWVSLNEIQDIPLSPADKSLVSQLKTLEFYESEGEVYVADTRRVNLSRAVEAMELTVESGKILDVGCGSGRDSLYFIEKGYSVTSIDSSPKMVSLATKEIGRKAHVANVLDLPYKDEFEGIWASSCLPHLPKSEFLPAVKGLLRAAKVGGAVYISLKSGSGEGLDDLGRYLSRYQKEEAEKLLSRLKNAEIVCVWEEKSSRRKSNETWINIILTKNH
jgi:mutator protein MutT